VHIIPSNKDKEIYDINQLPSSQPLHYNNSHLPYSLRLIDPEKMPSLLPDESYAYAFSMDKSYGQVYSTVGIPEVKWCSCMGEHGYVRGEEIVPPKLVIPPPILVSGRVAVSSSPTNESKVVRTTCINFPAVVNVGEEFSVTLQVSNESGQTIIAQLQAKDFMQRGVENYLCVCNKSTISLGTIPAGESTDVELSVFPLSGGTHTLRSIVIVDMISWREYPAGPLFRVMVNESDEMYDRWGIEQKKLLST